jgi:hypothetical protein
MCLVIGGCDWVLVWFILLDSLLLFSPSSQKFGFFLHGATASSGPCPLHYRGFTVILRHTTLGRFPLGEWSVRRRGDLTHKRQTYMALAGFEPSVVASERLQTHAWEDKSGIVQWNVPVTEPQRIGFSSRCKQVPFLCWQLKLKILGAEIFP